MNHYKLAPSNWGLPTRAACALASLLTVAFYARPAAATSFPLIDANTNITFDTEGGGVVQWDVDDVPQLLQEWYWLRIDEDGGSAETPIDNFDLDFENAEDMDANGDDDMLFARYVDPGTGIEIEVQFLVAGGQPGSGSSSLSEQVVISNNGNSTQTLHLFMYSDFNLTNTPDDDSANFVGAGNNTVRQFDSSTIVETVATPLPSHVQISPASVILDSLNDGSPTTLDDTTSLGHTDVTWAFQWDFTLEPGQAWILSAQKNFLLIPEPSTLTLMAFGLIGLFAAALCRPRRRR